MNTTLVCVVTGAIYEKFAEDLFSSADQFFHPTKEVEYLMLPGTPGWPEATMYRHHHLRDHLLSNYTDSDYVFLSDADMRFEGDVGPEILPKEGVAATLHPGYVLRQPKPYERREKSAAYLPAGEYYYCGGFVGGTNEGMLGLSDQIAAIIDADRANGLTPIWHDESALNRVLAFSPPEVTLSPSYCYPDDASYYRSVWPEAYERKLVALDKTEAQRGVRD